MAGSRDLRIAAGTARVIAVARRRTADRGLAGFTIDELCREAQVSRRTFFNWFATKEDAVIGATARVDGAAEERFVLGAGPGGSTGLSAALVDDLAELMVGRQEGLALSAEEVGALLAALAREPRLIERLLHRVRRQEERDTVLVERRERLPPGDVRASTAVRLLGALMRAAVEESLGGDPRPGAEREALRAVFARRLAAARSVLGG